MRTFFTLKGIYLQLPSQLSNVSHFVSEVLVAIWVPTVMCPAVQQLSLSWNLQFFTSQQMPLISFCIIIIHSLLFYFYRRAKCYAL